jgi:hypothetical protein
LQAACGGRRLQILTCDLQPGDMFIYDAIRRPGAYAKPDGAMPTPLGCATAADVAHGRYDRTTRLSFAWELRF